MRIKKGPALAGPFHIGGIGIWGSALEQVEHHLMMIAGLELVEAMANLALFVNEEAQPVDTVILLAHELLRAPDAKRIGHRMMPDPG